MACRLYTPAASAEELAAIGLLPEDVADTSITEIWEENYTAFQIFTKLRTQWRVGMAGPTGMDYNLLPTLFEAFSIPKKKRGPLLDDLMVMECEALRTMSANQEKSK